MSLYPQEIAHLVERLDGTAPDRTHWGFLLGLDAYRRGDPECPFLAHSIAAIQFHHGWQEAEEDARRADHQFDVQFEANYCREGAAMTIPFTQYLRPDGRRRSVEIDRSEEIESKAQQIMAAGYVFECEELTTGHVSLTIADPAKGEDVAIVVVPNGPDVPGAVDRLIQEFNLP